jgi:eukaryotic-like serine/threonine-protein kinase
MTTRVLGGRYEIDSVLGRGGMAEVYLGTDRVLGRRVAVKVLEPQFARDASFVARFRREAQSAAALNHPNVVNVFDTGSDDGTHFIVMEYVQGKTLSQIIQDAPLLPERAVEIAQSVAEALAFAHENGIIHRDVKPGNIMLTPNGDVKVMDFGIARATTSESLTQTATVLGTATYFSPEQAQGEPVDARSDVYSLGCVLYEMLTGQPPFTGDSPVAIAYKHVREDPVAPSRLNKDIPPHLDAIVMKAMAKNPANRYQSAAEMADDLGRFSQGAPVSATPVLALDAPTVVERQTRPTAILPAPTTPETGRRRQWIVWVVLGALLLVIGVALFFMARSLLAKPLLTVPDVKGKPLASARSQLISKGFVPGNPTFQTSDVVPKGVVIDYSPPKAHEGDTINLIVSSGKPTGQVPRVVCEDAKSAKNDLKAAGFKSQTSTADTPNLDCPGQGFVADQQPGPNETADQGSTVHLFLNPAPTTTTTTTTTTTPPTTTTTPPSPSPSV